MIEAHSARAIELELPRQWAAVDLTDAAWPAKMAEAMEEWWSDPALQDHRAAIQSTSIARVALMADQGAACLLLGSCPPVAPLIGGVFIRPGPTIAMAAVTDRFTRAAWRSRILDLNGIPASMFCREMTVPGLAGVHLMERVVVLNLEDTLVSMAFSSAVFGAADEVAQGVTVTDHGIRALLERISW